MNPFELEIVNKLRKAIEQKVPVKEIKVFGSRARGDAHESSDLDVLVIVDDLNRSIENHIIDCAWKVGFDSDIIIMPVILIEEQITKGPIKESVFLKNVFREEVSA
jgi:uncharacterized protein